MDVRRPHKDLDKDALLKLSYDQFLELDIVNTTRMKKEAPALYAKYRDRQKKEYDTRIRKQNMRFSDGF